MQNHIAVIDIGKTNAKLVLIDPEQGQIAVRSQPNTVLSGGPYPHYDIENLWEFILDGLAAFHSEHRVDAISITTHGATAALIAGDDLAMPVLDYEHDGPEETAASYDGARPDFSQTLSPRLPLGLNLGAQIYWQAKTNAEAFAQVTSILMYPQFWAWKLTGLLASEATSLGCHTDLWHPAQGVYSDLVATQNWTHLFPPLRKAASTLGPTTEQIAQRTGLPTSTPVATGIHDSNASLLPWLRALDPTFTVISSGTWTIHMTVGGGLEKLDQTRDTLANVDAFAHPVPTARFMGGREYSHLTAEHTGQSSVDKVLTSETMLMPGFSPGTGPFPAHKGYWINEPDNPGDHETAVSLYLALVSETCLGLCGAGDRIIVEGPFAKNEVYCSALSTLTGKPVHPSPDATGTSLGAAMLFNGFKTNEGSLSAAVPALDREKLLAYAKQWKSRLNASS